LSRNALNLLMEVNTADPGRLAMLRPSMVTIVNCMNAVQRLPSSERQTQQSKVLLLRQDAAKEVLEDLERETTRSVTHAVDCILQLYRDNNQQPLAMGTFSRSSTLGAILNQVLDHHPHVLQLPILCSRSIPGGEGELMAKDLNARIGDMVERAVCVDDDEMMGKLVNLDVLLIGADCILADHSAVINKVGSASLASAVSENRKKSTGKKCHVLCCTDRFKVWDDLFPPPLEEDLFELIPVANHIDQILLPPDEST
jgi:translation initiation factor 2B subunit (eIF-2B alpha/beta/delta family)